MKNLPIRPFHNLYYSQIYILFIRFSTEEYEPGLVFGAHMEVRIVYIFLSGKLNKLDPLEDLGIFGTIILKQTLTLRRLMSYIYGAPILDVSRSHTTTQHSR